MQTNGEREQATHTKNYSYTRITLSTSVGNRQASLHIHTRVAMQCWTAPICQSQWLPVPAEASRMAPPICRRSVLLPRSPVHTERLCDRMKTCPKRKCSSATCASTLLDSTVTHIIRHVVQHNYLPIYSHSQALTPSTGRMILPCKHCEIPKHCANSPTFLVFQTSGHWPDLCIQSLTSLNCLLTHHQHSIIFSTLTIKVACLSQYHNAYHGERSNLPVLYLSLFTLHLRPLAPSTHLL